MPNLQPFQPIMKSETSTPQGEVIGADGPQSISRLLSIATLNPHWKSWRNGIPWNTNDSQWEVMKLWILMVWFNQWTESIVAQLCSKIIQTHIQIYKHFNSWTALMRQQRRAVGGVVQAVAGGGWVKTSIRYTQSINILIDNIYIIYTTRKWLSQMRTYPRKSYSYVMSKHTLGGLGPLLLCHHNKP